MAHNENRSGMTFVAAAALIWGTIGVAVSLLYRIDETNPLSVGFLRLIISAPALLILGYLLVGPNLLKLHRRSDAWPMLLIGAAFAGYQVCYFAAITRLGVATAVLINICSGPIFTAILARFMLNEHLSRRTFLAMLGAISGTALLVGGAPQAADPPALAEGAALALGAGFCYSLVVIGSRMVAADYHPLQPIALAFSLGALLLLPFALAGGLVLNYSPTGWGILIYLGIVPTALGYWLYLRGMRSVPAATAAILTLLEPLGSSLLALLLLDERLAPLGVLGAMLLLASMALLSGRRVDLWLRRIFIRRPA
ncbi:MAG: EamA family transporter [Oscillochloris sp.]|nr:EamA family transporter [Oscillochloris sp.]